MNKVKNPEQYQVDEERQYSTLDTNGLCKF